jgi:hypothetical protein
VIFALMTDWHDPGGVSVATVPFAPGTRTASTSATHLATTNAPSLTSTEHHGTSYSITAARTAVELYVVGAMMAVDRIGTTTVLETGPTLQTRTCAPSAIGTSIRRPTCIR